MTFKKFSRKSITRGKEPMIAILKTGNFWINGFCRQKFLKDYEYVMFFYDEEKKIIGIKPSSEDEDAYRIREVPRGKGVLVSGSAFLKYFKIDYKKTRRFKVSWDDENKLLKINLYEEIPPIIEDN